MRMQHLTTVLTDDQDTKHNNGTNRGSGYKKKQKYYQTIRIQHLTTVQTDDQHKKHNNSTNRRSK